MERALSRVRHYLNLYMERLKHAARRAAHQLKHDRKSRSLATAGLLGGLVLLGAFGAWAALLSIPSVDTFHNRKVAESTKIYDRTGDVLLFDVHGTMRRTAIPLEDISLHIRNATIAIEDSEFYQHQGIRITAIIRAVLANLTPGGYTQGGSTITQQVVKNTLLTQDKTIIRKMKEWVLALKLEKVMTKDEILSIYLNETSYGGTIYGVEEASQYFYGVAAQDVTLAQAAYLAALPQAPTRYSPYGNNRELLENRKNLVLARMQELQFITPEEYEQAKAEVVEFKDSAEAGIKAPHFVFYVREYLEEKYGADAVSNGGLQVTTTLDYTLQKKAEEIVEKGALANEKNFNAENAGLVAVDPKTGQILAMVGSRGYFDEEIDGKVNVTMTHRQPGSSFKPFVYAAAFEKGYTPETILFDLQTQFSTLCSPNDLSTHDECYSPGNYDEKFRGPMMLRDALAQSINVVAVKLLYLVGLDDALSMAERMGITTLTDKARYGLTLVLGGGEVSLLELTNAYAVFANDGVQHPASGVLEVKDAQGVVLESFEAQETRALNPEIARTVSDVLSDNVARAPEFGVDSALFLPGYQVAAKTGTTNDFRDAWIVGYTPSIAVGAWAGNNDNSPMQKKIAGFIIAPLWNEFMRFALIEYPPQNFPPLAPDPALTTLPPVLRGEWNTNPSQGIHEILFWVDKKNPRGGVPVNPQSDPQFVRWEYPVAVWAGQGGALLLGTTTVVRPPAIKEFLIAQPNSDATVKFTEPLHVGVEYLTSLAPTRVAYFLNNVQVVEVDAPPFTAQLTLTKTGVYTLKAIAHGPFGAREDVISFTAK